jgi:glyoxylase I family protein
MDVKRRRREILQMMPLAIGASVLLGADGNSAAAQAQEAPNGSSTGHPATAEAAMEKVTGIGGFFFRAHDPKTLGRWYQDHLGVLVIPTSYGQQSWTQEAGETAFAPFPETTKYFGDLSKQWMINFRVRDLDKMAAQLRAAGIEVMIDPEKYPNGKFASLNDPEGNPIQLWQPA